MTKDVDILTALQSLTNSFSRQVVDGQQSEIVGADLLCCGQFIGQGALELTQRGIHGTAAALRVLGDSSDATKNNEIVQLVNYLQERICIETSVDQIPNEKLLRDDKNIIKISEVLHALSFIKVGVIETEAYKTEIYNLLRENMKMDKGWGYFIDSDQREPDIFPTASAVMGLHANGYDEILSKPIEFLFNTLKNVEGSGEIINPSQFAKIIYVIYVLTFKSKKNLSKDELEVLKKSVQRVLKSPFLILQSDIEQHLEYQNEIGHDYIRIPWQLYFIAICSKLKPKEFYKQKIQERLDSLVQTIKTKSGFIYSHYGALMSARTNAIGYDILKHTLENNSKYKWKGWVRIWDTVRIFFGKSIFRIVIKVILAIIYSLSIVLWIIQRIYNSEGDKIKVFLDKNKWLEIFTDLAPEFIGPILIGLFLLGKRN